MVDYKLLREMLEEALAKETSESWNQFLDDCYADSHLIDTVSTLGNPPYERKVISI